MKNVKIASIRGWFDRLDSQSILVILLFSVFAIPLFGDELEMLLYDLAQAFIFLWVVLKARKNRRLIMGIVLAALVTKHFLAPQFGSPALAWLAGGVNILVFIYAVFQLILDIARVEAVRTSAILDAFSGYLLLGLAFSSAIGYLFELDPGSFNFQVSASKQLADFNYFGFVTLSTLGYGDITPQTDLARSLSILGSVAGQMYVAVIVAMLVGKFSNAESADK